MENSQVVNIGPEDLRRRNLPGNRVGSLMEDGLEGGLETEGSDGLGLIREHLPRHASGSQRRVGSFSSQQTKARASIAYAVVGTFYLAMGLGVHHRMNSYPELKTSKNSFPYEFREETARQYLEGITSFGPRVSGSDAHVRAEEYILRVIDGINSTKVSSSYMDISVQTVTGGLTVEFIKAGLGEFSSVYQNLKNIVVKVSPLQPAQDSVLVNCHYDSVADSPGAGDDAASCAVMLEILRALSQNSQELMHNLIFLFNGAEENMLQTSHGFITQHPWAASIKAFVNMDSAGAGGWEIVFQTGPEHPWLIKSYIEVAPYPHASVVGQEIFQTGLIPSDTDFRIFRDYGNIPGIDVAHIKNGYIYHTRNDRPGYIPAGSLQRGGENMLATIVHLANSSKLTNPGEDKVGSVVFFDVLGLFMIAYSKQLATFINYATAIFVFVTCGARMIKKEAPVQRLAVGLLLVLVTWVTVLVMAQVLAVFLVWTGHSLSYYTHNLNVVWLFILPPISAGLFLHWMLKKTVFRNKDPDEVVLMLREANLVLWSVVLILLTLDNVMSAYIPLLFVLWPAVFYTIFGLLGFKPSSVLPNLVATFLPSLYIVYINYTLLMFIIPIMGRVGLEVWPDLIIAGVCSLPVMACLPYQVGFVYSHSRVGRVLTTTVAVILLGLISVLFTPAGFPYSSLQQEASSQRAILVHFDRQFHAFDGAVIGRDAAIWYKPLDFNGGKMLEIYAPEVFAKARKATCDGVYCGRPYYYPILSQVDARKTYDFPASRLNLERVNVELLNRTLVNPTEVRMAFSVSGPSHVTIFISGLPLVNIKRWSCGQNFPREIFTVPYIHAPTHFVYYSYAGSPNTTWEFTMDVQVERNKFINGSLIRMGFAGHYLHGPNQVTQDIVALEKELPSWMMASRWTATYDEYVF